ncbi:unnamed protein product [Discosporangium mesarthrocarpum]
MDGVVCFPPCKYFSFAGPRLEKERASLTVWCAQIAVRARPTFLLLEEVLGWWRSQYYSDTCRVLREGGCDYTVYKLGGHACGLGTCRERLFC